MICQFTFGEGQEMDTQPIYLSSGESENTTPWSSTGNQLPNNVPDSYGAIRQLIASQHEQMSASGKLALQYPPTPPTSLISDDGDNEIFTPIVGNPTEIVPYVPNRYPHTFQLC